MTPDETEGIYGRITPRRLLRFPAFAPFLAGFEPYSALLKSLRSVTYPAAVKEFPYDWRLPVAYTGGLLADFAIRHLVEWRNSEQEVAARRQDPEGDRPARLVIVAHSMGGLLVRQACRSAGFAEEVRATVTLGTPFSELRKPCRCWPRPAERFYRGRDSRNSHAVCQVCTTCSLPTAALRTVRRLVG